MPNSKLKVEDFAEMTPVRSWISHKDVVRETHEACRGFINEQQAGNNPMVTNHIHIAVCGVPHICLDFELSRKEILRELVKNYTTLVCGLTKPDSRFADEMIRQGYGQLGLIDRELEAEMV